MKISSLTRFRGVTLALLLTISPTLSPQTTHKKSPPTSDDGHLQDRLRFRLEINPHDKKSHDELMKLLRAKNAFRPELEEDGSWLKNNPDDYDTEIEMRSLAEVAVGDPEYANSIARFMLSHDDRAADPKDYDFVSDRLAFALLDRGENAEALSLLTIATTEAPDEPGVWQNLADAQVRTGHAEEALTSYRKSIDLDATQEFPHEGLAKALSKLGRYAEAESEMNAALSIYNAQYHGVPHRFVSHNDEEHESSHP